MAPFKCKCLSVSCLYLQNCLFYLELSFGQVLGNNRPLGFSLVLVNFKCCLHVYVHFPIGFLRQGDCISS